MELSLKMGLSLLGVLSIIVSNAQTEEQQKEDQGKQKKGEQWMQSGQVSLGYAYGLLPFLSGTQGATGMFSSEGNLAFNVAGLPLNGSFFYTDKQGVSGLSNYFRISFDVQRFRRSQQQKVAGDLSSIQNAIDSLSTARQQKARHLSYLRSRLSQAVPSRPALPTQFPDAELPDSLQLPAKPSVNLPDVDKATLEQKISMAEEDLRQLETQLANYREQLAVHANRPDYKGQMKPPQTSFTRFLSGVRRFDVGLCYPGHSTFLTANVPVRGLHTEYQAGPVYLAFTYGKVIHPLWITTNQVQNNLNQARNLYNFFDFNEVSSGRKIVAFKGGVGQKEGTHLYAGFLYGKGSSGYTYYDSLSPQPGPTQRNYVIEIDGRIKFSEQYRLDLIYGRSFLQEMEAPSDAPATPAFFSSSYRSNALKTQFLADYKKSGTRITLTGRLIDPFFRSFGLGFVRPNSLRYEGEVAQRFSSKFKATAFYRRERDNLISFYSVRNVLQTMGVSAAYRPNRQWMLNAQYSPVVHVMEETGPPSQRLLFNRNHIGTLMLAWLPKALQRKKTRMRFSMTGSHYVLFDGTQNNTYSNVLFTQHTTVGDAALNEFSAGYFNTNVSDSLTTAFSTILSNEFSYRVKNTRLSGRLSYAGIRQEASQWGYKLSATFPLYRIVSLELTGEKLIRGDFYRVYDIEAFDRFPFYCSARVLLNW